MEDLVDTKYLVFKEDIENIKFKHIPNQNHYVVDENMSQVIEFWNSNYDYKNNIIRRGRLYAPTGYYDGNEEWVKRSDDFIRKVSEIFLWFKKSIK